MSETADDRKLGLLERLDAGPVICAEGYLFELERRGYLQAGAFVPEVVLEHPELVAQLHREFVHAGSDVVEAFTYYAHREKLRADRQGAPARGDEPGALEIAKEVADESDALLAGDICNTNVFEPDETSRHDVRAMFEEQVGWAIDAGVDFVIAETFSWGEEALIALDVVKAAGVAGRRHPRDPSGAGDARGLVARRGLRAARGRGRRRRRAELHPRPEDDAAARRRRSARRSTVTWPRSRSRTGRTRAEPTFQSLRDPDCDCIPGGRPFPTALDPFVCNRYELAEFAREAHALGVSYLGVCCGAGPHHIRSIAEALGKDAAGEPLHAPTCPSTPSSAPTRR